MSTKRCVVTGAAGFIGSHLSEELVRRGHTVYGVDNLSTGYYTNVMNLNRNKFFFVNKDIKELYPEMFKDIDWFFHLAARADVVPSIENPSLYHDTNVTGTQRCLEVARKLKVKKFVYAASSSCYGDNPPTPTQEDAPISPRYPYALTKWLGEMYVAHWNQAYKLPATSLRLFNVYGPRSRTSGAYGAVIGVFLAQIANKKPLTIVGDGRQKRDFTHVSDVVRAFVLAAENKSSEGKVFNVGTGNPSSVNYLAALLGGGALEYVPDRPGEPRVTEANYEKIKEHLNWEPHVTLEQGIEDMLSRVQEYKDAPLWTKEKIAEATKTWFEYLT